MTEFARNQDARLVNDVNSAINIMREAGQWLLDNGQTPSKWWDPKNLNKDFLLQYATPEEFYTLNIGDKPAAAVVLQVDQNAQDWAAIDGDNQIPAMYIHWLCVRREFAGQGLPGKVINLAGNLAASQQINVLRADTNAEEAKLRNVYESIGFKLAGVVEEDYRTTAFYQKFEGQTNL